MSKPTESSATIRWATAPLVPGDVVEPDVTHKDEGWQDAEEPPHSFFNYWQRTVYKWIAYLENLEAETLTWTNSHFFTGLVQFSANVLFAAAAQFNSTALFTAAVTMTHGLTLSNPSGPALTATATGANPALQGTSSTTSGSFGISGIGANGGGHGLGGAVGRGGLGTLTGGDGVTGAGGDGNGVNAHGGSGVFGVGGQGGATGTGGGGAGALLVGGNINGATNTAGAAGAGGVFDGGSITSDANARVGGDAVVATAGQGQSGYGRAFYSPHGDIVLDDGSIDISGGIIAQGFVDGVAGLSTGGTLAVGGVASLGNDLDVTGKITAAAVGSSIAVAAPTTIPYGTDWVDGSGSFVGLKVWKDAFGVKHCEGLAKNTTSDSDIAGTIPSGFRPVVPVFLTIRVPNPGGSGFADQEITIGTDGVITVDGFDHTVANSINLFGVSFR